MICYRVHHTDSNGCIARVTRFAASDDKAAASSALVIQKLDKWPTIELWTDAGFPVDRAARASAVKLAA